MAVSITGPFMIRSAKQFALKLLRDESGPTAVEYAVMLALILAVCITSIATLGVANNSSWTDNSAQIDSAFKK